MSGDITERKRGLLLSLPPPPTETKTKRVKITNVTYQRQYIKGFIFLLTIIPNTSYNMRTDMLIEELLPETNTEDQLSQILPMQEEFCQRALLCSTLLVNHKRALLSFGACLRALEGT